MMIHILGWPTIYMCAFLSRADIHIPESAVIPSSPGLETRHTFIQLQMLVYSLSLSLSLSPSLSYYSPNRTQIWVGFSTRLILLWWCIFTDGGKRNVIRPSPSELEPNSVKMGCGNTAKGLIITLHMAVFRTAFVTKLNAQ